MADFQSVRKRGTGSTNVKYSAQQQTLSEMGFTSKAITEALECTSGNLDEATSILLGEARDQSNIGILGHSSMTMNGKAVKTKANGLTGKEQKRQETKDVHTKFMATHKIQKCKLTSNHDKRVCMFWHSKGDRRRNPFEIPYTCLECPNSTETRDCGEGDACLKAHNILERMFHPELYKIAMCQRSAHQCERGPTCAFAHSEEDHRIPLSQTLKLAAMQANEHSAEQLQGSVATNETKRFLDGLRDKLVWLTRSCGSEGVALSELPKKFNDVFGERMPFSDDGGDVMKIKDLLLEHENITFVPHRGGNSRFIYDETQLPPNPHVEESCLLDAAPDDGGGRAHRRGPPAPPSLPLMTPDPHNPPLSHVHGPSSGMILSQQNSGHFAAAGPDITPSFHSPMLDPISPLSFGLFGGLGGEFSGLGGGLGAGSLGGGLNGLDIRDTGGAGPGPLGSMGSIGSMGHAAVSALGGAPVPVPIGSGPMGGNGQSSPGIGGSPGVGAIGTAVRRRPRGPSATPLTSASASPAPSPMPSPIAAQGLDALRQPSPRSPSSLFGLDSAQQPGVAGASGAGVTPQAAGAGSGQGVGSGAGKGGARKGTTNSTPPTVSPVGLPASASPASGSTSSGAGGTFSEHMSEMTKTCTALRGQVKDLQQQLEQKTKDNNVCTKKLEDSQAKLKSAEQAQKTVEAENASLASQLEALRTRLASSEQALRAKGEELNNSKKTLKEKEAALAKAENTKNSLVPELKQLRTKLTGLESDLVRSKSDLKDVDKAKNALQHENDTLKAELSGYRTVRATEESSADMRRQLEKTQAALRNSKDRHDRLEQRCAEQKAALASADKLNRDLHNNLAMAREEALKVCADQASLKQEMEALRSQLKRVVGSNMNRSAPVAASVSPSTPAPAPAPSPSSPSRSESPSTAPSQSQSDAQAQQAHTCAPAEPEPGMCSLPGCKKEGPYICGGCKSASYCGTQHQKDHWRVHSKECYAKRNREGQN